MLKVFKITVTRGQHKRLQILENTNCSHKKLNEWWEYLSDITEHPPEWLLENIGGVMWEFATPSQTLATARRMIEQARRMGGANVLVFEKALHKDSGVVTEMGASVWKN
jgi:hypothetical protein